MSQLWVRSALAMGWVLACMASAQAADKGAQPLYAFGGAADGGSPEGGLLADTQGNLYGTTLSGGTGCTQPCGTIYRLSPPAHGTGAWTHTVLYNFTGQGDGGWPVGSLIADANGNLFGVGSGDDTDAGVVFEVSPPATCGQPWRFSTIYTFSGTDGAVPNGALVFDKAGALYGTTVLGGSTGDGVVFRLTPPGAGGGAWGHETLWSFTGGADGGDPNGNLVVDGAGTVFGTTTGGGPKDGGVAFALVPGPSGWTEHAIHHFASADGFVPVGGLVIDASGALYGATLSGGVNQGQPGQGVIFQLTKGTKGWAETVLHVFAATGPHRPGTPLTLDGKGDLFGGVEERVVNDTGGAVFRLERAGSGLMHFSWLHRFTDGVDGGLPSGALIGDGKGGVLGVTLGGETGAGVVFDTPGAGFRD